jgi:hypothetical protein
MGEEHGRADLFGRILCDESLSGGRSELSAAGRRVPTREAAHRRQTPGSRQRRVRRRSMPTTPGRPSSAIGLLVTAHYRMFLANWSAGSLVLRLSAVAP